MVYRFFFSYAWNNRGRPVERFYDDLAEGVRKLVGGMDPASFRDRVTMEAGTDWPQALLQALKTSQVLVLLLSPDYVRSEFCGKEFQVFLERVKNVKTGPPALPVPLFILPVIWVPILATETIPAPLARLQLEDDAFPKDYADRGLESLAKRRDKTAYNEVIQTLATRIVRAAAGDRLPPLDRYDSSDEIPNAFVTSQPLGRSSDDEHTPVQRKTGVRCVYVAPKRKEIEKLKEAHVFPNGRARPQRTNTASYSDVDGWHWQPFHPPPPVEIGSLVQQLAMSLPYREIPLGDEEQPEWNVDDIIRKLVLAANNDQIILLVVDAWAGYVERYEELLRKFDIAVPMNGAAVLVPWNEGDGDTVKWAEDLTRQLRVLFKTRYFGILPSPFLKPRITSIEEFRDVVPGVLEVIRITIESFRAAQGPIIESTRATPQVRSSRILPNE
jgi:FxsC-like protein